MRSLLVALSFIVLLPCNAVSGAEEPHGGNHAKPERPSPYTAIYTARYNGLPISGERTLVETDEGYKLTLTASNFLGKITEQEHFILAGDRYQLRDYRYERRIFGKSSVETLSVDEAAGHINSERKGETETLPLSPGLLGSLSHQQQLQADMAAGAETLAYQVAQRGRIKEYRYGIIGEESLDTPLGTLETVKLERLRDDDERQTYLWLAVALDYLPVKIEQYEDGDNHELLIKNYTEN